MGQRGKVEDYHQGSQYLPGKEKKKDDGSRKGTKSKEEERLHLRLMKIKVRMRVKVRRKVKAKIKMDFQKTARDYVIFIFLGTSFCCFLLSHKGFTSNVQSFIYD